MKEQFPLLTQTNICYLDSAATSQKPQVVIDAITNYYTTSNANVHRSAHSLAKKATDAYEGARVQAAKHINANPQEIILTYGTTHAFNLLAGSLPITSDTVIVLSELEHHANIVCWQQTDATIKYIPQKDSKIDLDAAKKIIGEGCDIISVTHLSNVTGSITDIQEIVSYAKEHEALVFVDGAQAAVHLDVDVKELGVDAYAFSAHKVYGPTGIGALYVDEILLEGMRPFMTGGEMITEVTKERSLFAQAPNRFEPGTPPIAQAAGFCAALVWFAAHKDFLLEEQVMEYAYQQLQELDGVRILSCLQPTACLSFVIDGVDSHDLAAYLDTQDVAIRSGHHCAQILHDALGVSSSARISVAAYTTTSDIDRAISALKEAIDVLGES